jgi:hypothetical protein
MTNYIRQPAIQKRFPPIEPNGGHSRRLGIVKKIVDDGEWQFVAGHEVAPVAATHTSQIARRCERNRDSLGLRMYRTRENRRSRMSDEAEVKFNCAQDSLEARILVEKWSRIPNNYRSNPVRRCVSRWWYRDWKKMRVV